MGRYARGWNTTIVVASGPSLTDEQIHIARVAQAAGLCHAIVVNDNYRKWPNADVLYACDEPWWKENIAFVRPAFDGQLWTQSIRAARAYSLNFIPSVRQPGLTRDGGKIYVGGPSGAQAINLAYLFGSRRMILLGFDCKRAARSTEYPNGKLHWFGSHPKKLSQGEPRDWIPAFREIHRDAKERGVKILNASPDSALTFLEQVDLAEALQ